MATDGNGENGDSMAPKRRGFKLPSLLLTIAWIIIVGGTVVIGLVIDGLFGSGHLQDEWTSLTEAQSNILGQLITVYAAAFAAVVTPAIFSSKFASLEDRIKGAASEIESLSQQTKNAFHTLNETTLAGATIKSKYNETDLTSSREVLRVIQAKTAEFAQSAKDRSRKWRKKEVFKGKWPTRQNYVELLHKFDMITKEQFEDFMIILRGRRFTHGDNPQSVTTSEMNKIAEAFERLQKYFDGDRLEDFSQA